jgi:sucrose-6-phosphate hydrolase SacC (GH32 family)
MVVAGGILRVFTSTDLLHWRFENASPDITTECPDLFELPVEGEPARRRWVLSGGGRWYMLGQFDGTRFMPETGRLPMAQGPDCYATQTWSDAPAGRRVAIAWLFSWRYQCGVRPGRIENTFPTTPWAGGCLTVPYELTLRATPDGDRLMQRPVPELTAPRQTIPQREPLTLNPGAQEVLPTLDSGALDLEVDLEAASGGALVLHLPSAQGGTVTLTIAPAERRLTLDRRLAGLTGVKAFADSYEAPLPLQADGGVTLRLLIDRSSIEVFAGEGALQFSAVILPDPTQAPFLTAQAGPCRLRRLVAHTLK